MSGTQVHVHLFYGADPRRYRKGENIGSLYGYHHAESAEFALNYARDVSESTPVRFARRALKAALGFDFIHAWRNRRAILDSDVIWTHTEQEHLAVALVLLMNAKKGGTRPLLLAQSVWLLDRWPGYGALRRAFYRRLLKRADLLTTLASENAALCGDYFDRHAHHVLYGLNTNDFPLRPPSQWKPNTPVRVAGIGNDRDRDWTTLMEAFGGLPRYEVKLATRRRIPRELHRDNVEIASVSGIARQREFYDWADVIVVPLRPNHHASGITVMLEAAAVGKPMIVSDVGGLRDYFPGDCAAYVPAFDASAMRGAADRMVAQPERALGFARAASTRLVERDLTTEQFAAQHARITRELLQRRRAPAGAAAPLPLADSRTPSN